MVGFDVQFIIVLENKNTKVNIECFGNKEMKIKIEEKPKR